MLTNDLNLSTRILEEKNTFTHAQNTTVNGFHTISSIHIRKTEDYTKKQKAILHNSISTIKSSLANVKDRLQQWKV